MRNGTGRTFDFARTIAEQEFMLADDRGDLTWANRIGVDFARLMAAESPEVLMAEIRSMQADLTEWQTELLSGEAS